MLDGELSQNVSPKSFCVKKRNIQKLHKVNVVSHETYFVTDQSIFKSCHFVLICLTMYKIECY